MARAKPKWRKVLTGRYLRWWLASRAVGLWPGLGQRLGFFPKTVDMIEAADRVLADEQDRVDPDLIARHRGFLDRCLRHDSVAPGLYLDRGVETGWRTALYRRAWVDMSSGAVLLPGRGVSVLMRGTGGQNTGSARFGRERVKIEGRAVVPLFTNNYFHVITENAVRLLHLYRSGLVDDAPPAILTRPGGSAVERAMLAGLSGRFGVEVHEVAPPALVEADELVCHFQRTPQWEWPPLEREVIDDMAALFAEVYGPPDSAFGPDLYLSRGTSKLRGLTNAEAVEGLLADAGFDRFVATDSNHPEQIARFRAARQVVAVHGAGLTNLVFCQPGTRVIEIFPGDFVKSTYWWICQSLGLEHVAVIGGAGDYDQTFAVEPAALRAALEG